MKLPVALLGAVVLAASGCSKPAETGVDPATGMLPAKIVVVPPPDVNHKAREVVRLRPSEFPGLPPAIVAELERRNCTIPQSDYSAEPHNAIKGRFTRAGQIDWAVLCSDPRNTSILVFRNGSAKNVAVLGKGSREESGSGAHSHEINVADPKFIRDMNDAYGHVKLPRLDHDGINDAFDPEKASTVLYWNGRRWLELAGAD